MGILNVTPDSFSDGGLYDRSDVAIEHAIALHEQGAHIIDVGGESTRPGAERVTADQEAQRVLPVIRELVAQGISVSIDTMNSRTALLALEAGASVINDVSGGLADPAMHRVAAETGAHYIAMHWRGHLGTETSSNNRYGSVVADVRTELTARITEMAAAGISPDRVILDPGLGFSKTSADNWALLRALPELAELGFPIVVGASRKRFLGDLLVANASVTDRDPATAVISALAAQAGAWGVRVHDVQATRSALAVWDAWTNGTQP